MPDGTSLIADLTRAKELPRKEAEMKDAMDQLNQMDRATFEQRESELRELGGELTEWEKELRERLQNQTHLRVEQAVKNRDTAAAEESTQQGNLRAVTGEFDVSQYLARVDVRDVLVDFKALLAAAGCDDGDKHAAAEHALREATREGWLTLETHRRDASLPTQIRLPIASEATLFSRLGETTPTERREAVARQFTSAAETEVPAPWHDAWRSWCLSKAAAVRAGGALTPFDRENVEANAELLALLPRLLGWRGESLIRFASCVLCGNSKRLAQVAGSAASALAEITDGRVVSLEDLGILENPRSVLIHGPLQMQLDGEWLDFGRLRGPIRLSGVDVLRAGIVATTATRCLTVENETSFYELAKLQSGELLVQTSYPGSATLGLLSRLPAAVELWHFGDTDPEGFDILRDLRARLGREVRALHMAYRPSPVMQPLAPRDHRLLRRLLDTSALSDLHSSLMDMLRSESLGHWEQESLGLPTLGRWPFYGSETGN